MPDSSGSQSNSSADSLREALAAARSVLNPGVEIEPPVVDGYEVVHCVARGGTAMVWRAIRREDDRDVALKIPLDPDDPEYAERLLSEGEMLRTLHHPHIVGIPDITHDARGRPVLVLEFMGGSSLASILPETGFSFREALRYFLPVLEAMEHAHRAGVIHRDLKPSNVLLTREGVVKVSDFGLARPLRDRIVQFSLTRSGAVAGTVEYLAPECYRPDYKPSAAADVFALGVMLYELLAGTPPRGSWQPLSQIRPVDVRLDELISSAIHPDPRQRLPSVREFRRRLLEIRDSRLRLAGTPLVTRPVRVADLLWTVAGAYACVASFCSLLVQSDTPVPAIFDLSFYSRSRLMSGFLAVWVLSLGIAVLWCWQLARMWRFRRVPVVESLPAPLGMRVGSGPFSVAAVCLSQICCAWLPVAFTVLTAAKAFRFYFPGARLWEPQLIVTDSYVNVEPLSPWAWKAGARNPFDGNWLVEATMDFATGRWNVLDRTGYFPAVQPPLMVIAAILVASGMLVTLARVVAECWIRRRRWAVAVPIVAAFFVTTTALPAASRVKWWFTPHPDEQDAGFFPAAQIGASIGTTITRLLATHDLPPDSVPPGFWQRTFARTVRWNDDPPVPRDELPRIARTGFETAQTENRITGALEFVPLSPRRRPDDFTLRYEFHEFATPKPGITEARFRIVEWEGTFHRNDGLNGPLFRKVRSKTVPAYTAEDRVLTTIEVEEWLHALTCSLNHQSVKGLDSLLHTVLLENRRDTRPRLLRRENVVRRFRTERRRWKSFTVHLLHPIPPPEPLPGGRHRILASWAHSGTLLNHADPVPPSTLSLRIDLAHIGDAWRAVGVECRASHQ